MNNKIYNEKEEYEKVNEVLKNSLKSISKVMKSDSFMCSMYFLKYLEDHDEAIWNKFIELFNKLSYPDRIQAMANTIANLKEREKNKVKMKGNE